MEFQGTYRNAQIERISPRDIYAIIKEARQQKHKHHQQQENTPAANNGEQHKNDNNNIKKYLEFNRDRILDFAQKNYENLVEVFTNNAINSAVTSSSNPTSSVPQSSSRFSRPSTRTDTYRTEESEIHHNSKGDIAD